MMNAENGIQHSEFRIGNSPGVYAGGWTSLVHLGQEKKRFFEIVGRERSWNETRAPSQIGIPMTKTGYISAGETDLLSFFEVEPTPYDVGIPWPYNDFLYEVTRGDVSLSFAIEPASKDVRIIAKRNGEQFYELNAMGIDDVLYHKDQWGEILEIVVNARDRLQLRVKPRIVITHEVSVTP